METPLEDFLNESTFDDGAVNETSAEEPLMSMAVQQLIMLGVIMAVALVGNCIILATLTCSRYRVRIGRTYSRVSIFILNLAVSDLAVCFVTMPGEMIFIVFGEWVLGAAACKLILFGQIVALASTIFNLMAMSYDRYLAICQPLRFRNNCSRPRHMIAVAWLSAFLLSIPQLFIFIQVQKGAHPDGTPIYDCASHGYTAWWQRRLYFSSLTVFILVMPAAVITFCYASIVRVVWQQGKLQTVVVVATSASVVSLRKTGASDKTLSRAKLRTIKLTLYIILAFVTCWTPYFVVHNLRIHTHYQYHIPVAVREFVAKLALINSALNPIVYGCFNLRVKKVLRESCCVDRPRSAMDYILGGARGGGGGGGPPRTAVGSECSSSCAEETIVHASATSIGGSPAGSAKFRLAYSKLNGGGGLSPQSPGGEHGDLRRANSSRRSHDVYEMKQRPTGRKEFCS